MSFTYITIEGTGSNPFSYTIQLVAATQIIGIQSLYGTTSFIRDDSAKEHIVLPIACSPTLTFSISMFTVT